MSVFPALSYKKAHRHGPGVVIIIPSGEGFSVMWPEGQDKVFIPWHEGSVFVPPNRWYHQHFNVDQQPGRYLAFHAMRGFTSERVEDRARDQIEYPDEDPIVRGRFQEELGKRGHTSRMPEIAYQDANYEWDYDE
jgi:gentisate 1,2-dioxygenase